MTSTEQKIFNIIRRTQNKTARVQYISRFAKMSSSYVDLVCQGLCRRGHINFMRGLVVMPASADISTDSLPKPSAEEINAQGESPASNKPVAPVALPIVSLEGVSSELVKALEGAGCATVENLAETPIAKLMTLYGMNVKQAADLINQARRKLGTIA